MPTKSSQYHVISFSRDQLFDCSRIYEIVSVDHEKFLIHMRFSFAQGVSRPQKLILFEVSDLYAKINAILEIVHDPFFLIAHDNVEISNAVFSQSRNNMLHERAVSHGKHDLGSGLGKRPASATFSCRQYDSLQIYHSPDESN